MDTSVKNVYAEKINFGTSCLIEEEALQMGLEAFFAKHTYNFTQPKGYRTLRNFARAAACNLPDYCSFDAFFAKFEGRFEAWYETGNFNGIADDPAEE